MKMITIMSFAHLHLLPPFHQVVESAGGKWIDALPTSLSEIADNSIRANATNGRSSSSSASRKKESNTSTAASENGRRKRLVVISNEESLKEKTNKNALNKFLGGLPSVSSGGTGCSFAGIYAPETIITAVLRQSFDESSGRLAVPDDLQKTVAATTQPSQPTTQKKGSGSSSGSKAKAKQPEQEEEVEEEGALQKSSGSKRKSVAAALAPDAKEEENKKRKK